MGFDPMDIGSNPVTATTHMPQWCNGIKHRTLLKSLIEGSNPSWGTHNINAGLSQYIGDCSCPVQAGLIYRKYTARDNVYE